MTLTPVSLVKAAIASFVTAAVATAVRCEEAAAIAEGRGARARVAAVVAKAARVLAKEEKDVQGRIAL